MNGKKKKVAIDNKKKKIHFTRDSHVNPIKLFYLSKD